MLLYIIFPVDALGFMFMLKAPFFSILIFLDCSSIFWGVSVFLKDDIILDGRHFIDRWYIDLCVIYKYLSH